MPTTPPPSSNDQLESTDGHFQIIVPNFGTAIPVLPIPTDGTTTPPVQLSSFLRLGTSATTAAGVDNDPPSTFGSQLLGMAIQATPIAAGNLVNDGITTGSTPPMFSDDVRDQGIALNANGLTPDQRVAESNVLFTKGGWRDHTDGNRISTTFGDKVEVIRGNYKLVVLGRQDSVDNLHTFESSGGMLQDNDCAPGQVTEISYIEEAGTWRVVETCTKGDVDSTYDGKVVERFVGGSVTTIVGKESQATVTNALAAFTDADASTSTDPTIARMYLEYQDVLKNDYIDASVTFSEYVKERGYSSLDGTSPLDFSYKEGGGSNPFVFEQTWASRIESYTGSSKTWVPKIIETIYANEIEATTNVDTLYETTNATTINETVGSSGSPVTTITEKTYAHTIDETVTATVVDQKTFVSGSINELTTVPLETQTQIGALVDTHVGFKWENVIGAWGAIRVGVAMEVFLGFGAELNFGPALELNLGISLSFATVVVENEPESFKWGEMEAKQVALGLATFGFYGVT